MALVALSGLGKSSALATHGKNGNPEISPRLHEEDRAGQVPASWGAPAATRSSGRQMVPTSNLPATCQPANLQVSRCFPSAFQEEGHHGFPGSSGMSMARFQSGQARSKKRRAWVRARSIPPTYSLSAGVSEILNTSGRRHDEVGKVREEHKDPGDDHHGGGVQVPVLKGGGGHCQVRRQVPKPLGVGKHVVAAGAHHVQAQNQHLRAHEEHGHGPRDPKPAQLCRGGTNAVVAHLEVKKQRLRIAECAKLF